MWCADRCVLVWCSESCDSMYWCCVQTGVIACTGVVVFRQVTLFEELVLLKEYEKSENVLAEKVANKQQEKLEMHNKVSSFPC